MKQRVEEKEKPARVGEGCRRHQKDKTVCPRVFSLNNRILTGISIQKAVK